MLLSLKSLNNTSIKYLIHCFSIKINKIILLSVFFILISYTHSKSHPHMWIDLTSKILVNDEGLVSSIEQEWLFGDFSSAALIDDISRHPKGLNFGLKEEISKIFNNLYSYNYFTLIKADSDKMKIGRVVKFDAEIRGMRVWIKFILPILTPIDLNNKHLTISIFDPTYYIEMLHLEGAEVMFLGKKPNGCNAKIIAPSPSEEVVMLSKSPNLDINPDTSIGRLFAEIIDVKC